MKAFFLINLLVLLKCIYTLNANDDEIHSLPGLKTKPLFKHYSGYLNASKDTFLHYWFVESQHNPDKDPVVLWLTGGPGCSSISGGMFTEIGPWRLNSDGKTLNDDPNSWNTIANVIFLESPAEVGYSYTQNHSALTNDNITAEDNYLALRSFFEKFPQFKKNNFYITGESYAGIYIPMLAYKIVSSNSGINFKGIAIGNGLLDYQLLLNSKIKYAYSRGLIDPELYHDAEYHCCKCENNKRICDFSKRLKSEHSEPDTNDKCSKAAALIHTEVRSININRYNIYDNHKEIFQFVDSTKIAKFLDSPEARKALHIKDGLKPPLMECNSNILLKYKRLYQTMKWHFQQLFTHKLEPIIIYNGDNDIVCDFIGDFKFVDSLGLDVVDDYRPWKYQVQTAGFVKRYSKGVSFVTVKGAGHMVPTDKPKIMLEILNELIGGAKLSVK